MKRLFILLTLAWSCQFAYSQTQILFQSNEPKAWLLTYMQSSGDESQRVINEMLSGIATYIPKPVYQTKATFNLEQNIRITRSRNEVSVFVAFQNMSLSGDVFYKGFDFTDVMLPSSFDFTAALYRNKDGALLANYTQNRTNFSPPYTEVLMKYNDTSALNTYYCVISNLNLYYDGVARQRFRDKAMMVDQYYQADLDLKKAADQLNQIDANNFENLNANQDLLSQIDRDLDRISFASFWQGLHIEAYDPAKIYPRLFDNNAHVKDIQTQLDYTRSVIHQLYFDKALKLYEAKKIADAKLNFEKSLSFSPYYAPSKYYLARIAFDEKRYEDCKQQLKDLFRMNSLDEQTRNAGLSLCNAVEWVDMNVAAGQLSQGKFDEALNSVQKAEDFCKSITGFVCNDTIELIRRDSYRGLYNNHVAKAGQLLGMKNLDEAEKEAQAALDQQKQHATYIPDNAAAQDVYSKIKVEQYYLYVKRGKDYMTTKNYRTALDEFTKASYIEAAYPVKKDRQLPELTKSARVEVMLLDLKDAENAVAANNLTKARDILRRVMDDQRTYDLIANTRLNTTIESLKKSIFSQECMNAQKRYDEEFATGLGQVDSKDYINAVASFGNAVQVSESNRDCGINAEQAISNKRTYETPATYQRAMQKIGDYITNAMYESATADYLKMGDYFKTNKLEAFGFNHAPLPDFMMTKRYEYVMFGVTYFANNGDPETGMKLMKHLRNINVNSKLTKMQQLSLARAMAVRDLKSNPALNAKLKVTEYTLGDKWYAVFSKEYIKQVKSMQ
jgi:hypothetical protein